MGDSGKCRRCKRYMAACEDQFDNDEDGKLCARHLDVRDYQKREYMTDCWAHLAHVQRMKLYSAVSLLQSAELASFMHTDYQASCATRIREFLTDPETQELLE